MNQMRTALLQNPTVAAQIRKNEIAQQIAAQKRAFNRAKYARDVAIQALIKARRSKKRSRELLAQVQQAVVAVRATALVGE